MERTVANDLLATQPTTSSLEQRVSNAKAIVAKGTTPSEASQAAKTLVGSFAHLRPDNPQVFIASIAAVLAQYPRGVVEECVDPRCGIARKVEFLSIKALVEWCDVRLAFYQALASYSGTPPKPYIEQKFTKEEMERGGAAMRGIFQAIKDKQDIKDLTFEQAIELGSLRTAG
jgi:hypothetical protein